MSLYWRFCLQVIWPWPAPPKIDFYPRGRIRSIAGHEPDTKAIIIEVAGMTEFSRCKQSLIPMNMTRRSALQRTAAFTVGAALPSLSSLRAADAAGRKLRAAIGQGENKAAADIDLDLWQGPVSAERDMKPYVHSAGSSIIPPAKSSGNASIARVGNRRCDETDAGGCRRAPPVRSAGHAITDLFR